MRLLPLAPPAPPPALRRLAALAPLDAAALDALRAALVRTTTLSARRDLVVEGAAIRGPLLIAAGWAARVRHLVDGRRQLLSFLLPGDLVGACHQDAAVATSTVTALTEVQVCAAPPAAAAPALARVYALSHALDEAYLLEQIMRLGRLSALDRICGLLLEFDERLALAGLAAGGSYDMPMTQEMLADALGLTSVHVNRMVQEARRAGHLTWQGGRVALRRPDELARLVGRRPARVIDAAGRERARG